MFGKCSTCSEKESRINDLKAQIEDLRKLVFPKASEEVSYEALERDSLLGAYDNTIVMRNDLIDAEASALLSGTYDNSDN